MINYWWLVIYILLICHFNHFVPLPFVLLHYNNFIQVQQNLLNDLRILLQNHCQLFGLSIPPISWNKIEIKQFYIDSYASLNIIPNLLRLHYEWIEDSSNRSIRSSKELLVALQQHHTERLERIQQLHTLTLELLYNSLLNGKK